MECKNDDDDFVNPKNSNISSFTKPTSPCKCDICGKDISSFNQVRRLQHINRCLDDGEQKKNFDKKISVYNSTIDCPLCKTQLPPGPFRVSHLKKCSNEFNVNVSQILQLVKTQEDIAAARRAKNLPHTNALQPTFDSCAPKKRKNQLLPKSVQDEQIQLALSLSRSEIDQFSDVSTNKTCDKRTEKKDTVAIPSLLESVTVADQSQKLQERLFLLINNVAMPCDTSLASGPSHSFGWWNMHFSSDPPPVVQMNVSVDGDNEGCESLSNNQTDSFTTIKSPKLSLTDNQKEETVCNNGDEDEKTHLQRKLNEDGCTNSSTLSDDLLKESRRSCTPDLFSIDEDTGCQLISEDYCDADNDNNDNNADVVVAFAEGEIVRQKDDGILLKEESNSFVRLKKSMNDLSELTVPPGFCEIPLADRIKMRKNNSLLTTRIETVSCETLSGAEFVDLSNDDGNVSLLTKSKKNDTFNDVWNCDSPFMKMSEECERRKICNSSKDSTPTVAVGCVEKFLDKKFYTILKRSNVTPMPNYETFETPELKKALGKYGVKPMARRRAVPLLKKFYDETHPFMDKSGALFVKETKTDVNVKRKTRRKAKVTSNSGNKRLSCSQPIESISPSTSDSKDKRRIVGKTKKNGGIEKIALSQEKAKTNDDSSSSSSEESDSDPVAEETFVPEENEPLFDDNKDVNEQLRCFFTRDVELYRKILRYEPLPLKEIHCTVKSAGILCSLKTFMDFLDAQCITFTMKDARKPGCRFRTPKKNRLD